MRLYSAPGRRLRQPHPHHRSADPVLHQNRRCLAARPRRSARRKAGSRRPERTDRDRGNRYHVRDRLEGPLSHRGTSVRLLGSGHRPDYHHPRLPDRQAHPGGLIGKFQICLARFCIGPQPTFAVRKASWTPLDGFVRGWSWEPTRRLNSRRLYQLVGSWRGFDCSAGKEHLRVAHLKIDVVEGGIG